MGGAIKGVVNKVTGAAQQVVGGVAKGANTLVGNKTEAAPVTPAAPAPAPAAPAPAPAPALAPVAQEVPMQRRKRGRASSLLATDSTSAPQTAAKALLGQ